MSYKGYFFNNLRHGQGEAIFEDTKYLQNASYLGTWENGIPCGEGELTYDMEFKYGRERVVETHTLTGNFVNGVYQGRMTSRYDDELPWQPFGLQTSDFQDYTTVSYTHLRAHET